MGRIRRVIATDIDQIAYIVFAKEGNGAFHIVFLEFVAAGSQGRRRCIQEPLPDISRLRAQVNNIFLQESFDTIAHSIDVANAFVLASGLKSSDEAGINNGG